MRWSSFKRMSCTDLKAICNFMKTLQDADTGQLLGM
jgi:hypothetical protein